MKTFRLAWEVTASTILLVPVVIGAMAGMIVGPFAYGFTAGMQVTEDFLNGTPDRLRKARDEARAEVEQ